MKINNILEQNPIIAAVNDSGFDAAIDADTKIIFYLKSNLLTVKEQIKKAKNADKLIFVHIDLAEGIGKDRTGIEFLKQIGTDGIISTRAGLIKMAREAGLITVQRFFAFDTQGLENSRELIDTGNPDLIEIMPGVICKAISRFSNTRKPIIAGGLIETKAEVTSALSAGAIAVSTGKCSLWGI